jgi:hypothetical protein
LLGAAVVGTVAPKRVRVAGIFDVVWSGKEPISLRDVKESDGQVVMTLVNETGAVVDGVQISSTPPPEGGCKKNTHPFADERGLGFYSRPYPRSALTGSWPERPRGLNLAPGGTVEIRLSAVEMQAAEKRRKLLVCDPHTPSLISLVRVCLRDGSEWMPPGWNVIDRTAWCPAPAGQSKPRP